MDNQKRHDWNMRARVIGRAKKLFDEGKSSLEVAAELGISESKVRSIKATIDKAEENKK